MDGDLDAIASEKERATIPIAGEEDIPLCIGIENTLRRNESAIKYVCYLIV